MTAAETGPWPRTWSDFWRLTNQPRPFMPRGMQIGCWCLLGVYASLLAAKYDAAHPELTLLRGAVCGLAGAGIWLAPRITWHGLRRFAAILALLMPLEASYVGAVHGNGISDLAVTAIASFTALAFVQSARDILLVTGGLAAGHALILGMMPPPAQPVATVVLVLVGGTGTGAVAALSQAMYRAGLQESMAWWRRACERERVLREFAQAMTSHRDAATLPGRLAQHFRAAFGDGRCAIVLARESGGFDVVATAGFTAEREAMLRTTPLSDEIGTFLRQVVHRRQPLVREHLGERERGAMAERWGHAVEARALVALPLIVEDVAAAVVVLSATTPRRFAAEDLGLWSAMAHQAGIALANTQLLARLEHALGAKSEFLNTMSHELRSPLHVVVGYADMLREEEADSFGAQLAGRIRIAALDLLRLVEDTMSAARLEAGRVTVRADEFATAEVVDELAQSMRALPEAQGEVAVHWEVEDGLPVVRLDRLKVKEIVQNLVSNALKFTPAGEVRVHVGVRDGRLRIAVRDTGVGIPREAQARIFEMFERIEASDGQRQPGVGLGLYIVHRLVGLMGGTIELESAPQAGSTFVVSLPLVLPEAA